MKHKIVFYVTGHGFGHATRAAAVMRALGRLSGGRAEVVARTDAPAWLFAEEGGRTRLSRAEVDVGMVQRGGLDVDLGRTLAAHQRFIAGWEAAARREASWLARVGPSVVAADIPPLAAEAASRAGVPCVAFANFGWDWVLRSYARRGRAWAAAADFYAVAYAKAAELLRLPMHGGFPAFGRVTDVPLIARRSGLGREEARAAAGLSRLKGKRVVLLSFGGLGRGRLRLAGGDDLRDHHFIGTGSRPEGLKAGWTGFPARSRVPHPVLVAASDLVLGKPGYGLVSECLAARRKLLHLPREDFPETPALVAGLSEWGTGALMPRRDFLAGRWRRHLDALAAAPDRWADIPLDGDEAVARRLLRP